MIEEYIEKAWDLLKEFQRITPILVARKFRLDLAFAQRVCEQVWLRQNREARAAALELENYGFDSQLQRVDKQNLEKFKGKRKKSS